MSNRMRISPKQIGVIVVVFAMLLIVGALLSRSPIRHTMAGWLNVVLPTVTPTPFLTEPLATPVTDPVATQPPSPLTGPVQNLRIDATLPVSRSTDVRVEAAIMIGFNRPVVLLAPNIDQSILPHPMRIEPATAGKGKWVDANNYHFFPNKPLAGGTTYRVEVEPFVGIDSRTLEESVVFTFTTALPAVNGSSPGGAFVRPDVRVDVEFDQPMDGISTRNAFSLQELSTKRSVNGYFVWANDYRTLKFFPRNDLNFDEIYLIQVDTSAMPASRRGNLRQEYRSQFATLPLPYIEQVLPAPGEQNVWVDNQVTIRFSTLMSPTSVIQNLRIEPVITTTQIISMYLDADRSLTLNWRKEPLTPYTITLGAQTEDLFGNRLGKTIKQGVPISPTGIGRNTLLTFTTSDLRAYARLNIEGLSHLSAFTDTFVGLYYRNITDVRVNLYQVPLSEFARLSNNPLMNNGSGYTVPDPAENLLWTRRYELNPLRNLFHALSIGLVDKAGKRLLPGLYLVEVTAGVTPQNAAMSTPLQTMIVLSNHNIVVKKATQGRSLAWLTDLRDGSPVANRSINFLVNGFLQSEVETDDDGLAFAHLQTDPNQGIPPVVVVSGRPGEPDFALGSSEWSRGIAVYDFNLAYRNYDQKYITHFYTDRPIYRPGQRVNWKGLLRRWRNERYELPDANSDVISDVTVVIRNNRGTVISQTVVPISEFGTVDGFLDLGDEMRAGDYRLEASFTYGPGLVARGGATFLVAAYRKPEFDISVRSERSEYIQGEPIRITTDAAYFSGSPLAGANLRWRLVTASTFYSWRNNPPNRPYSFTPFDPDQLDTNPYAVFVGGLVKEGVGKIAANGSFVLELPADLEESFFSQQWTVDVTVQSSTNQFVSRQVSVMVHRGDYYAGIAPEGYVLQSGKSGVIHLASVRPNGEQYPNAELTVSIYEYRWNHVYERLQDGSYQWKNSIDRQRVFTDALQTDDTGAALLRWTPKTGGQYLVTVRGKDAQANPITSAQMVWVSEQVNGGYVAWPQNNHDRLELVADKALYRPGEVAHILIPSPFSGTVQALVTVELGGVVKAQTIELTSNSALIDVPILEAYVPSAYVSVVLLHIANPLDTLHALRVGYVQLKVDSRAKALQIDVQPSATSLHPGETIHYTLTVQTQDGKPAVNSEVSVALIDKSLLSLQALDSRSLLDIFYYERGVGVTTGSTLIINHDRQSQEIGSGQKGGGGGGGGGYDVRHEFPDVAWWRANYVTNRQGEIEFDIKLPGNLTRWLLIVKAIDKQTYVGETTHEIVATKELQVRPLVPRFFTAGDQTTLGAVLVNTTKWRFNKLVANVEIDGATLVDGHMRASGHSHFTTMLAAGAQTRLDLPIQVLPNVEQVVITVTASAQVTGSRLLLQDALRIVIPVKRFMTPQTIASAGQIETDTLTIPISLPSNVGTDAELIVNLEGSLAAGMLDGLSYLEHFEYECNEQTISRFLPNIFTVRAFRTLGITNAALERQLDYQVAVGVQRMMSRQNDDGGWGYWPGNASSLFTTSYVLWGLHHAREFGHPISDDLLRPSIDLLERSFITISSAPVWQLNEAAFRLFVLTELGRGDPGQMSVLYDNRERLGLYGKAFLAMSMAKMGSGDSSFATAVDVLINDVLHSAQFSADSVLWREPIQDYQTMNSDIRTSALILEMLQRLRPDDPILPAAVRGLMNTRQSGYWGDTQGTAWSIIALTNWLRTTGELEGNYTWQVQLDGHDLGTGIIGADNLSQKVELRTRLLMLLQNQTHQLAIKRSNPSGQLYYSTQVRYSIDAMDAQPLSQGVTIDRQLELTETAVNHARVGELISVTLRIVNERELHHLLLEVPIPAGTEPLDLRMATESNLLNLGTSYMRKWLNEDGTTSDFQQLYSNYVDMRDEKVVIFADYLPPGRYFYTFLVRATTPGTFKILPAYSEMMYHREVMGRSGGATFTIKE